MSTPDEERPAGSPRTASAGAARPISRIGLGIVIVVAVLFVAAVVTLAIVAARQDWRVLTPYTGSPPVGPASPAHKPSAPSGNDRAVGPMQFIPTSWATWATDADADGRADPQDIDDAALAAGRYLCSQSRDLSTADGWWAAVLSYNNSVAYAQQVLDAANTYAHLSLGVG